MMIPIPLHAFILGASLALSSCGYAAPVPPVSIDSDLYPYYESFISALAARNLSYKATVRSIHWVEKIERKMPKGWIVAGMCTTYYEEAPEGQAILGPVKFPHEYRVITISREADAGNAKTIIWHELGHCMLDLCHSPTAGELMYQNVPPIWKDTNAEDMLNVYEAGQNYTDCNYDK